MFKKLTTIISIFILGLFTLNARDLQVDYLEGYLDIQSGRDWNPIDIGDVISENDTIRLSDQGYSELLMNDVKITLDKDGVYDVLALLKQIIKADTWGIKSSSFAKLFRDDEIESRQSAVMGVRGDPQNEEKITWVDDDIEFLEEGKSLYKSGDFEKAFIVLEEGAEWDGSNYEEILFYRALCEFELGHFRIMRNSIFEMDPDPGSVFFGDFVLLKGNLLIETQDYIQAEELFDRYLSKLGFKDDEQMVYLLSAFCSLEQNEVGSAKSKLRKSILIDSSNEIGRKASDILNNL